MSKNPMTETDVVNAAFEPVTRELIEVYGKMLTCGCYREKVDNDGGRVDGLVVGLIEDSEDEEAPFAALEQEPIIVKHRPQYKQSNQ